MNQKNSRRVRIRFEELFEAILRTSQLSFSGNATLMFAHSSFLTDGNRKKRPPIKSAVEKSIEWGRILMK
jgi:hypothetical protein